MEGLGGWSDLKYPFPLSILLADSWVDAVTLVKFPLPKRKGKLASSLRLIYIYNSFFVFLSVFRLVFTLPLTMGWMRWHWLSFQRERERERGSGEWLRPQPPPNLASTVNSPKRRKTTPNVFLPWLKYLSLLVWLSWQQVQYNIFLLVKI